MRYGLYEGGVDDFKRAAQLAASSINPTNRYPLSHSEKSRKASVALLKIKEMATKPTAYGHVLETLGTKGLIADEMYRKTGRLFYRDIAQDAVAMIVNDAATGGVMPIVLNMLLEVGSRDWFQNRERYLDLIEGWKRSCSYLDCAWGGGETPILEDVLYPDVFSLSGSMTGACIAANPEALIEGDLVRDGDQIVFIRGSGPHANGISLARRIAKKLEHGYLTEAGWGLSFGDLLLRPTPLYSPLVANSCRIPVSTTSST